MRGVVTTWWFLSTFFFEMREPTGDGQERGQKCPKKGVFISRHLIGDERATETAIMNVVSFNEAVEQTLP